MNNLKEMTQEELELRKVFVKTLGEYAKTWVNSIQNVILKHVEDLYQDKSFCLLLKEWKKTKDSCDKQNENEFLKAYLTDRNVQYVKPITDYSDAIYLLCIKRYRSEIKF